MRKTASLPKLVLDVIQDKGTERPFSGNYNEFTGQGTYLCRHCGLALFRSSTKFPSGCGWPSFDEEIRGAVKQSTDADGQRIEILCSGCDAHLGHVFKGEGYTDKNTRHCVNSASLDFVSDKSVLETEEGIFAAGCFWGVEHLFKKLPGVLKTEVGYTGGHTDSPNYKSVCHENTGHYEAVRIVYDPKIVTYEALTKYFFEIHNFSQDNGQGPDIGHQYLSVIFYYTDKQKSIAEKIITILLDLKHQVSTKVLPVQVFWAAEKEHQDYYDKFGKEPYCHTYTEIFK